MRTTPTPFLHGRPAPLTPAAAAVPRRVTDDCSREWAVQELTGTGRRTPCLLFQCSRPGVRPEVRRADRPLAALGEEELLEILGRSDD